MSESILYVGRFKLPEGNAASNRVLAVSDILAESGYRVCLVGLANGPDAVGRGNVRGHDYLALDEKSFMQKVRGRFSSDWVSRGIKEFGKPSGIVYYNYSSLALCAAVRRETGVAHIADCTEWYGAEATPVGVFRGMDSEVRMRVIHPRMDGVLAISSFLEQYYEGRTPVLELPPMVNLADPKWQTAHTHAQALGVTGPLRLVYAGDPGSSKDGLSEVVEAVETLDPAVAVRLDIYGLTEAQANALGVTCQPEGFRVFFHGRVPHSEALEATAGADFVIFARRPTRANRAGFSTKLVETITLGTGIITTRVGEARVLESIASTVWIEEVSAPAIREALIQAAAKRTLVTHELDDRFATDRYRTEVSAFFERCLSESGPRRS